MAMIPGYKTTTTLRMGSTGEPVKQLQYRLGIKADGIFGSQTKAAVISFQKKKKISADGIAGKNTLTALGMYGSPPKIGPAPSGTVIGSGGSSKPSSGYDTGNASALPGQMLDKLIGGVILFGIYRTFQKIF